MEMIELTDVINQVNIRDIYETFHTNAEYTFFSAPHWTFSKIITWSQSKPQKIEENWNNSLHPIITPGTKAKSTKQKQKKLTIS